MEGLSSKAQAIKVFAAGIWGSMFVWHTLRKSCLTYHRDWKAKLRILFVSVSKVNEDLLQIMLVCCFGSDISGMLVKNSCTAIYIHDNFEWVFCVQNYITSCFGCGVSCEKRRWLTLPHFYRFHFLDSHISQPEWELVRLPGLTSQNILIVNNWVGLSYITWVKDGVNSCYTQPTDWLRKYLDWKMTLIIFLFSGSIWLNSRNRGISVN